jgi:hypothetical protein
MKWVRNGDGVGIEFTALSPEATTALTTFLASFLEQSNPAN